jgi:cytochrome c553
MASTATRPRLPALAAQRVEYLNGIDEYRTGVRKSQVMAACPTC